MANLRYTFLTIALLSAALCAKAQNGVNSPYSRYGFGVLSDRSMGFNKGMAGVAQGFRDGQTINVANPASYSAVDTLTALFDLGLTLSNNNYKMSGLQKNIRNSSFDYAAMHFRVVKGLGVAAGVLPLSNINYSFSSSGEKLENTEDITSGYSFSGNGGLRQVFVGLGWQPFKPISIGANLSYIWGEYNHDMKITFSQSSAFYTVRNYSADISTYSAEFGIQYTQPISKKDRIIIGATYGLGHDINSTAYRITQTQSQGTSSITIEATDTAKVKNAFQLPHTFAAGITFSHLDLLKIGLDVELQKWSKAKFPNNAVNATDAQSSYVATTGQLFDREKIAIGASYIPNPFSAKFANRITYKVGAYYARNYAKADVSGKVNTRPTEFGISAGVSLPIANKHLWNDSPMVNVSVQWASTNIPYLSSNTGSEQKLIENYLRLNVGMTISERWFHKWKVK